MQTTLSAAAAAAAMVAVAIALTSFGVAVFSEPHIQDFLMEHPEKLWENDTFLRVNQWLGII